MRCHHERHIFYRDNLATRFFREGPVMPGPFGLCRLVTHQKRKQDTWRTVYGLVMQILILLSILQSSSMLLDVKNAVCGSPSHGLLGRMKERQDGKGPD